MGSVTYQLIRVKPGGIITAKAWHRTAQVAELVQLLLEVHFMV